ncbi:MAG: KamA family radical SAM protein [Bdellovibrionales bacterium]
MKFHFPKVEPFPGVPSALWSQWPWQFKNGLTSLEDFSRHFALSPEEARALATGTGFQVRSTPYYAALAHRSVSQDPIRRMILPRIEELRSEGQQLFDPLGERKHSPRERLIHRYPDRVLFLVTDQCSLYCRYCLRKHFTGQDQAYIGSRAYEEAIAYLRSARGVREVILSGGDPLTLGDARLERLFSDLRGVGHLEIIRVGTRMPVVCPMRVTEDLAKMFRRFKPVFVMTHFNHPRELTSDAAEALERFVDHGVPVFNQMVLLNGINNHPAVVQALSRRLLFLRVKPYYMFQCDPSEGSEHFRTSIEESLAIQRELWGRLSGLALPSLSLDIPGGGGKVGLTPDFEVERGAGERTYVGWDGVRGVYANPGTSSEPCDPAEYEAEWLEIQNQDYGAGE